MNNNNINTLSPNYSNNVDDSNKAKTTLIKNTLDSKKNHQIKLQKINYFNL